MAGLSAYLTPAEVLNAPIGVDLKSIAPAGATGPAGVTGQQWYESLMDIIYRASARIDSELQQTLQPSLQFEDLWTDGRRAGVDNNAYLWLEAAGFPVISVQSYQYGYPSIGGTSWNVLGSGIGYDGSFPYDGSTSWTAPSIGDVIIMGPRQKRLVYPGAFQQRNTPPLRIQVTYWSGYPNTLLTASASAGASSLALADLLGIVPSQQLQIYDQGNSETVTVSPSFSLATGAGSLPLASPTRFAHTIVTRPAAAPAQPYDIAVSALGPDIKQAALLIVKQLVEKRGTTALVMGKTGGATAQSAPPSSSPLSDEVCRILQPYKRIV